MEENQETKENKERDVFYHPEIEEGEIFLGNFTEKGYMRIVLKSKRKGEDAYSIFGELISKENNLFPVFVNEEEYKKYIESTGRNYSEFKKDSNLAREELIKKHTK